MKKIYTILIFSLIAISVKATPIDSAKTLYDNGKFAEALPIFKELLAQTPNDASLNYWVGTCLYETGNQIESKSHFLSAHDNGGNIESSRYLAYIATKEYQFDDADKFISSYKTSLTKAGKEIPTDIEKLSAQIMSARNMLDRVENIQIIDSINVDSKTFFEYYRLSSDMGTLNPSSKLPDDFSAANQSVVFIPESKTRMVWAMNDSTNKSFLVSSSMLSDGSWESPQKLSEILNDGGNANYPYITPDGVTLYFANDGNNSIGGYDIFISRFDEDGYLQPLNLGMPYNSPCNDYMLVIDEITGIGWWATDRNNIEGKVTIYMFIPAETRVNHQADSPNIINFAKINAIKDTWPENADYSKILGQLNELNVSESSNITYHFTLNLSNGKIYNSLSDFKNPEAANAMQEYLDAVNATNQKEQSLNALRLKYAGGDKSVANQILNLEKQILNEKKELIRLQNIAISLECK